MQQPLKVFSLTQSYTRSGGYDPVLELEKAARAPAHFSASTVEGKDQEASPELEERIRRAEQDTIDRIIKGQDKGHYYLLLGPKGSGKTSMMIQAVSKSRGRPDLG